MEVALLQLPPTVLQLSMKVASYENALLREMIRRIVRVGIQLSFFTVRTLIFTFNFNFKF